jgi:uncharacterized protein YeaO (DUF488 family)
MPIRMKRAYEKAAASDGERFLVERLWPRGVKKADMALTAWLKDLAPSTDLRKWYGHQPDKQPEFARQYRAELAAAEKRPLLLDIAQRATKGNVTLVFATKEAELSGAVVLKEVLENMGSPLP